MEGKVDKRSGIMAVNGIGELQNKKHTTAPQSIYIVDVFISLFISLFILPRIYRREIDIFSKTDFSNAEHLFFLNTSEDKYLMFPRWMGVGDGLVLALKYQPISSAAVQGFPCTATWPSPLTHTETLQPLKLHLHLRQCSGWTLTLESGLTLYIGISSRTPYPHWCIRYYHPTTTATTTTTTTTTAAAVANNKNPNNKYR